ncbi:MAG TPA: glycosyltransferase [Afifellaceae bacterium]|nr:glycosyltransferase [Afifellaceae bacterium]
MRFAFFGSSLVSAYWNGAATYYRGLLKALASRGHQIAFYEPDAFDRQAHRDIDDPDWARVVVFPADAAGMDRALADAARAEVVVKFSGVGALDRELEAAVAALRRPGRLAIFWDVDAPATLERVNEDSSDAFLPLVPQYDAVLTYGGGEAVVDGYMALGARLCVPIYNALDPDTHFPAAPDPRFQGDLGCLGNGLPDREARVERFFLDAAARLPGRRFVLGGSGWETKPMPGNVAYVGHVYTRDHNAFNGSSLAVLNVNRDSMARFGASPPTRIFEAAGAGACIITDAWTGIDRFLEPGTEILTAESGEEVAAHLEALDRTRAAEIGRAALERVHASHTYAHRAAEVEGLLEGWDALRVAV